MEGLPPAPALYPPGPLLRGACGVSSRVCSFVVCVPHWPDDGHSQREWAPSTPDATVVGQHAHDTPGITDGSHGGVELRLRTDDLDQPAPLVDVRTELVDQRRAHATRQLGDAAGAPAALLRARTPEVEGRAHHVVTGFESGG